MWQYSIMGLLVLAATVYAARKLGPRRWRQRAGASAAPVAGKGAAGQCGCGKEGGGCH